MINLVNESQNVDSSNSFNYKHEHVPCQQNVSNHGFCESKAELGTEDFGCNRLVDLSTKSRILHPNPCHILEELTFEEVQKRFVNKVLEMDGKRQETR